MSKTYQPGTSVVVAKCEFGCEIASGRGVVVDSPLNGATAVEVQFYDGRLRFVPVEHIISADEAHALAQTLVTVADLISA